MKRLLRFSTGRYGAWRQLLSMWLLTCMLLAGSGCTSGENSLSGGSDSGDGNPIVFRGTATASRATITSTVRKIGVFGYSHEALFAAALASRVPDYFLNQAVIDKEGNGAWSYSGVTRYWPREGTNLSFFAYAPYIDVENTFTLYPSAMTNAGEPTITYTVPANIYNQVDLLWSNAINQTYANSGGQVNLEMQHALTRVDFQVKIRDAEQERPFTVEFTGLALRNIFGSGKLHLSTPMNQTDNLWTIAGSGWSNYTFVPGGTGGLNNLKFDTRIVTPGAGETDAWNWNSLFTEGQYLMLIPQSTDDAEIELKYTVTNVYSGEVTEMTHTLPLSGTALPVWKAGMGVTYRLTMSLVDGVVIEFDIAGFINGTPWENINSGTPIEGTVS